MLVGRRVRDNHIMASKTEIEWAYRPEDLFEDGCPAHATPVGEWTFKRGRATFWPTEAIALPDREEVWRPLAIELGALLNARSLISGRASDVDGHPWIRQHSPNGTSHTMIFGTGRFNVSGSSIHVSKTLQECESLILATPVAERKRTF